MDLEYRHLLPDDFPGSSRVWIYQSNRLFALSEALEIEQLIKRFCGDWQSHGDKVNAYGNLLFGQFLVLMANETAIQVSGCSTDSSVRLMKQLEATFNISLFDRQLLAFVVK